MCDFVIWLYESDPEEIILIQTVTYIIIITRRTISYRILISATDFRIFYGIECSIELFWDLMMIGLLNDIFKL